MPYQLILVNKFGHWNTKIEFEVKAENIPIIGENTHYVP